MLSPLNESWLPYSPFTSGTVYPQISAESNPGKEDQEQRSSASSAPDFSDADFASMLHPSLVEPYDPQYDVLSDYLEPHCLGLAAQTPPEQSDHGSGASSSQEGFSCVCR